VIHFCHAIRVLQALYRPDERVISELSADPPSNTSKSPGFAMACSRGWSPPIEQLLAFFPATTGIRGLSGSDEARTHSVNCVTRSGGWRLLVMRTAVLVRRYLPAWIKVLAEVKLPGRLQISPPPGSGELCRGRYAGILFWCFSRFKEPVITEGSKQVSQIYDPAAEL